MKMSQTEQKNECMSLKVLYDVKNLVEGYLQRDLPESAKDVLRKTVESLENLPVCSSEE